MDTELLGQGLTMDGNEPKPAPVTILFLTLNEAHNLHEFLNNLDGFAEKICAVDSFSSDGSVEIAQSYGVEVTQREFSGFGDQWNFALNYFKIDTPWVMKLDPDERLSNKLKESLRKRMAGPKNRGLVITRQLFFMGFRLPVEQKLLRAWPTGSCAFSNVQVNEHPLVEMETEICPGILDHLDSPDLHHWVAKQNSYSSAEANSLAAGEQLSASPNLWGSVLERRMWLKLHFRSFPFRYSLLFLYFFFVCGAWKAGVPGYRWASCRVMVQRLVDYKLLEVKKTGHEQHRLGKQIDISRRDLK